MSSALLTCISLWKTTGLINGVGWNWPAFQTFLPSHIIERIKAVMIHDDADLEDRIGFGALRLMVSFQFTQLIII